MAMEYLILAAIGISMGFLGGLLGIGGSIIMIPALVFFFGENQHLYQASAMICNFFVSIAAVTVHKKVHALTPKILKWLILSAIVGVILGVAISNSSIFARENSYFLARVFGIFMIFAIIHNLLRFVDRIRQQKGFNVSDVKHSAFLIASCGLVTGVAAGLTGIGGGIVCIPLQQFLLKMPLKQAISNSAATIASMALIGAFYKNVTLPEHNIAIIESIKMAAIVSPCAVVGAVIGGLAVHKLHNDIIRAVFILIAIAACYEMLTVAPV